MFVVLFFVGWVGLGGVGWGWVGLGGVGWGWVGLGGVGWGWVGLGGVGWGWVGGGLEVLDSGEVASSLLLRRMWPLFGWLRSLVSLARCFARGRGNLGGKRPFLVCPPFPSYSFT